MMEAIYAGLQVGNAIFQGSVKRAGNRAAAEVSAAQAEASNKVRGASNVRAAAQAGLSRFLQSTSNARALDASARRQAGAQGAVARMEDARTSSTFEGRVRAAEALGEQAAAAAFSGVTGGSADVATATLGLTLARQEQQAARLARQQSVLLSDQIGEEAEGAIAGLDTRLILDNLDLRQDRGAPQARGSTVFEDILNSGANFGALFRAAGSMLPSGASPAPTTGGLTARTGSVSYSDLMIPTSAQAPSFAFTQPVFGPGPT
jgi:hypothetical protein